MAVENIGLSWNTYTKFIIPQTHSKLINYNNFPPNLDLALYNSEEQIYLKKFQSQESINNNHETKQLDMTAFKDQMVENAVMKEYDYSNLDTTKLESTNLTDI